MRAPPSGRLCYKSHFLSYSNNFVAGVLELAGAILRMGVERFKNLHAFFLPSISMVESIFD